jgi:hypothetical protein
MLLDRLKKDIINQLVALDEGRELRGPVEPYFRAFTGAFGPGMPFTFYFEARNRPLMLVYDEAPYNGRSSHALFMARCEGIKAGILPIAGFAQELADKGYVTARPLEFGGRPPLPPDYQSRWRTYKHFYADVAEGLSFVCFSRLKPTQKLYDVWVKFNPGVLEQAVASR